MSIAASLDSTPGCPYYACGNLPKFLCVSYDSVSNTNTVQECDTGSYCPFNYTQPYQSLSCKPYPMYVAYPGEYCDSSLQCAYGDCLSNKTCSGYPIGRECNDTIMCAPGLYCKSSSTSSISVCSPLIPAGLPGCTHSSECSNLAFCNISALPENSYCQASLSFAPNTLVAYCYNGINYMCENLYCVTLATGSYCTSPVTSIKNLPVVCEDNRDCTSASDPFVGTFFVGNCSCGANSDGNKYCYLFPGDLAYQNYVYYLGLWMNSEKITYCNSKRRLSLPCIQTYLGDYYYNVLVYYMYMVNYYPYLQGNSDCVQNAINNIFWDCEKNLASQPVDSSSVFLVILGALYLV